MSDSIRPARPEDVPIIARMGEAFHAEAGWADIVDYVVEDCEQSLSHLISAHDGILLVLERDNKIAGFAGGMASPIYFNFAHKTGQEFFYWIKPGSRGDGLRLLDALENEARRIGCKSWVMISLDKVSPEQTGNLYERRGYRASEHTYIKRLG